MGLNTVLTFLRSLPPGRRTTADRSAISTFLDVVLDSEGTYDSMGTKTLRFYLFMLLNSIRNIVLHVIK